jgi:hypothetical protein
VTTDRRACLSCWGYGTLQDDHGVSHECHDCDGTGDDTDREQREFRRTSYVQVTGRLFPPRRTTSGTRRAAR